MRTTAEGMETREQMRRLRDDGCSNAQGFLLSKPVPTAEIEPLIEALDRAHGAQHLPSRRCEEQMA